MKLQELHIDPLEKQWIFISLIFITVIVGVIVVDSLIHNINTPSNVESINSSTLHLSEEFREDNLGVQVTDDGRIVIRMVAGRYGFFPKQIEIPAETRLTFRWVSMDVIHGVHMPMTNMSTMIIPNYVSEITTIFPKPGEYPMLCNEYCGMGHDHMWSNVKIVAKENWLLPIRENQGDKND